jgi:hypothetical protein
MQPDTTLTLSSDSVNFEFARYEIPEHIDFGGEQRLTVHELVGGTRIIDAMGASPKPIEWTGFFVGENALDRALYLDGLRAAGAPLTLAWSALVFDVVIKSFTCEFQRYYRLPYSIACEVVQDRTNPITDLVGPSIEQLITDDMGAAAALTAAIGDDTLTGLMGTLDSAIASVGSFATAAQSQMGGVLGPLADVRERAGVLLAAASNAIQNVATLGGVLPGSPIAALAGNLTAQINAVTQSPALLNLDRALGRVQANIGQINGGAKTVAVAGGDLYQIAAAQYGDPMGWTAIALANGATDPQVSGIAQLTIPPYNSQTGGVLRG